MTLLFTLCIAAPVALILLSVFSGTDRANRAQQQRFETRRAKRNAAAATVVPLPAVDAGSTPAQGEAAA